MFCIKSAVPDRDLYKTRSSGTALKQKNNFYNAGNASLTDRSLNPSILQSFNLSISTC
ncbi:MULTISPECIES: hypothetical protein [unclassified Microcoleus]|uniref:hypothetical protein n=1 Tax=unclassified Microcoleus TaxID=2642155 RepID=UPI002FD27D7A